MIWILTLLLIVILIVIGLSFLLVFKIQFRSAHDGSDERRLLPPLDPRDHFYHAKKWYRTVDKKRWHITAENGVKLQGIFIDHQTNKTVIIAHGYRQDGDQDGKVASLFHKLGFNVLLPDDRGHGFSTGSYIGFGWLDRRDYVQWSKQVIERLGPEQKIILWGISMGGATVMMTSGESDLPAQVMGAIADCGYTSVESELKYQFRIHHAPTFPVLNIASLISKVVIGYGYKEASSVHQLKKNHLPMLFIHGEQDHFVPFNMLNEVIISNAGSSQRLVVHNATHANSYRVAPHEYETAIKKFLLSINLLY